MQEWDKSADSAGWRLIRAQHRFPEYALPRFKSWPTSSANLQSIPLRMWDWLASQERAHEAAGHCHTPFKVMIDRIPIQLSSPQPFRLARIDS